ncbi:protein GPR108 isoform X1 [Delphinapterus leucas]|uniref:Protein GPR108 isoform X1 n=1 Tax=Delphinapterus leucas TaxID=9749 RepID=A0A2Y9LUQ6_DELLE|nr:protein GPR108 isoform X1 [Delphinapterus leucas]
MAVSERRGLARGSPAEWGKRLLLLLLLGGCSGRIHRLTLTGEKRADIQLNSFGFYTNGSLEVDLSLLRLGLQETDEKAPLVGFSLTRVRSGSVPSYSSRDPHDCPLRKNSSNLLAVFLINTKDLQVQVRKYGEQKKLFISPGLLPEAPSEPELPKSEHRVNPKVDGGTTTAPNKAKLKPTGSQADQQGIAGKDQDLVLGLGHLNNSYNFSFHVVIGSRAEEGQYNLNFHNCYNSVPGQEQPFDITVSRGDEGGQQVRGALTAGQVLRAHLGDGKTEAQKQGVGQRESGRAADSHSGPRKSGASTQSPCPPLSPPQVMIREKNPEGFLSAAEIPLFKLYMVMSACFLASGIFWVSILCKNTYNVFKIHWLMAALAFTKSVSLLFHSINYYFINSQGHPIEGLAVMHYITHLLKGALLFITIALIGSGWAFVKYILSDKEKKVFGIVISLQVLANVAYIVIESREEGTSDYGVWKEILFLVDLICCGAILFPVVWSIRHLQDTSGTDGKVAVNLAKLKLFRHYYVMVICYIYFTRIIAILLRVAVPFQWQWLYQLLVEGSTLAFFVLTGYKFQPTRNNPYLQLPQEDEEDVQMKQVMTDSGFREGLSKVNKTTSGRELL